MRTGPKQARLCAVRCCHIFICSLQATASFSRRGDTAQVGNGAAADTQCIVHALAHRQSYRYSIAAMLAVRISIAGLYRRNLLHLSA
jgi:hypothetical protein